MKPTSLILSTLFSLTLFAQEYSLIIKKPFQSALFDITQSYDGNLFAVGFSQSFPTHNNEADRTYTDAFEYLESLSEAHGTQIHLLKADQSKRVLLSKALKLSQMNEARAVAKLNDGGFIVGGHTLDGALLLVKISAEGELYFSQTYGATSDEKMSDMILLPDGGVLVIGTAATSRSPYDDLFESGLGKNDIYLLRVSKSGEKLWSNKYGTAEDDAGVSIAAAKDGSFMIAAQNYQNQKNQLQLLRINETGAKLWQKTLPTPYDSEPTKIISLRNSTFLVALKEHNKTHKEHIRLIKCNLQGEIVANKEIFTNYPSALLDIAEFADGSLMGVGYVRDGSNTDALAMQISRNLTLLNQEHYGAKSHDAFSSVTILNNSQVAAAGVHTDSLSQESNMWIVKLNANATLAKLQTTPLDTGTDTLLKELRLLFAPEIAKGDLKINADFTIELIGSALYFQQGEYKLTKAQEYFLKAFAEKLMQFLLKHKNKIAQLQINGHTSSEWANTDFTNNYIQNAELSMQRSFAVMHYIFTHQNHSNQIWLSSVLQESGWSYSKKVVKNGVEAKEKSRRVNFKIILK